MDTGVEPAEINEDEDLCDFNVCASGDVSEKVADGFVDVGESKLGSCNVYEAVDGSKAGSQCVVSFVDER